MKPKAARSVGVILAVMCAFVFGGGVVGQTTSSVDMRNFEVISVDGNRLVVRDEKGTEAITVPADFRFTVDGKKMAVSDLKPGMKGTAVITTTTTVKPVVVTEVREATVLRASDLSITVRKTDGTTERYTQGQVDTSGIQIFKEGRPVRMHELRRGDKLTATIVSDAPPVVLTEKEVQATLDEAKAEPTTTAMATAPAAAEPAATAAPATTPAAAPAVVAEPTPAAAPTPPAEPAGGSMTLYVGIVIAIALALFLFARRRKAA